MRVAELTVRGKRALVKTKIFLWFPNQINFFPFFHIIIFTQNGIKNLQKHLHFSSLKLGSTHVITVRVT